jgi:hypothetical protein
LSNTASLFSPENALSKYPLSLKHAAMKNDKNRISAGISASCAATIKIFNHKFFSVK